MHLYRACSSGRGEGVGGNSFWQMGECIFMTFAQSIRTNHFVICMICSFCLFKAAFAETLNRCSIIGLGKSNQLI